MALLWTAYCPKSRSAAPFSRRPPVIVLEQATQPLAGAHDSRPLRPGTRLRLPSSRARACVHLPLERCDLMYHCHSEGADGVAAHAVRSFSSMTDQGA
jgi:hypothetical protein